MTNSDKSEFFRTTPFPNELIDDAMPRLNDTQWRVLCVIVRQTLGWHDPQTGNRKIRDWLTQSQLKSRTGRNVQALAAAIELLVKQCYIVAEDESGNPLHSPQERRAYRGRCYYRLADVWLRRIGLPVVKMPGKDLTQAAQVVIQPQSWKTEFDSSGKSNRTKETLTKETEWAVMQQPLSADGLEEPYSAQLQGFIALFGKTSQAYSGAAADVILAPQQSANLKRLLEAHPGMDWKPYLQIFFESNFQYIKQRDYALSAFVNTTNILLLMKRTSNLTGDPSSVSSKSA